MKGNLSFILDSLNEPEKLDRLLNLSKDDLTKRQRDHIKRKAEDVEKAKALIDMTTRGSRRFFKRFLNKLRQAELTPVASVLSGNTGTIILSYFITRLRGGRYLKNVFNTIIEQVMKA